MKQTPQNNGCEQNPSKRNSIKRYLRDAAATLAILTTLSSCNNDDKVYTVQAGDTLLGIAKEYVSEGCDNKTISEVVDFIVKDNEINDKNTLKIGQELQINEKKIKKIEEKNRKSKDGDKDSKVSKIEQESSTGKYIEIKNEHTFQEMANSDHYWVNILYRDQNIGPKIRNALNDGYSVLIPEPLETKDSPCYDIDEITKPEKLIDNILEGKTFVLDPGHGSQDPGAVTVVQYGNKKEKIVLFESPIMMDITYRVARGLRSHGATVYLSHYYNRRGISENNKSLPPCSRVFNSQGEEIRQDIWGNMDSNSEGGAWGAGQSSLNTRARISNAHNPDLFLSFHADVKPGANGEDNKEDKWLSIKTDKNQPKYKASKTIAKDLQDNGMCIMYNGKPASEVKIEANSQGLGVLRTNNATACLIECGNMANTDQAYIFRNSDKREEFAINSIVNPICKTFGNQ